MCLHENRSSRFRKVMQGVETSFLPQAAESAGLWGHKASKEVLEPVLSALVLALDFEAHLVHEDSLWKGSLSQFQRAPYLWNGRSHNLPFALAQSVERAV